MDDSLSGGRTRSVPPPVRVQRFASYLCNSLHAQRQPCRLPLVVSRVSHSGVTTPYVWHAPAMRDRIAMRTAHTADLDAATLTAARSLMHAVFCGEMTDHDWEHALGGVHALVWERGELSDTRPWSSDGSSMADARCGRATSRESSFAATVRDAATAQR